MKTKTAPDSTKLYWEDILKDVDTNRRHPLLKIWEDTSTLKYNDNILYGIWYNTEKSLLILDLFNNYVTLNNAYRIWNQIKWEESIPEKIVNTWKIYSEFGWVMEVEVENGEKRLIKTKVDTNGNIGVLYILWSNQLEIVKIWWIPHILDRKSWEKMNLAEYERYIMNI